MEVSSRRRHRENVPAKGNCVLEETKLRGYLASLSEDQDFRPWCVGGGSRVELLGPLFVALSWGT